MMQTTALQWLRKSAALAAVVLASVGLVHQAIANDSNGRSWWDDDPWSDPDRGFNWYPPDAPVKKPEPLKKAEPPKPKENMDIRKAKSVPEIRKIAEKLRDEAIMYPTEANILAYLDANNFIMNKGSFFTDMSQRVTWKNPEVDYNNRNPNANFAQVSIQQTQAREDDALMKSLAKTHGFIFFFRGDCQYCHIQAPIMKMLRDQYKIEILAVSGDGGPMEGFPDAKPDNGISMMVSYGKGIAVYPSTYLISKDQKEVVPIGSGILAMDEIVNRVRILTTTQPGTRY